MGKYKIHIFFICCFLICLVRACLSFCWTDESFYISTADRFFRGDCLIKEEWYRTQMSSVVCLPFYALFYLITGSNAGIILYFRILYLILSFITAVIAYRVLIKEYSTAVCTAISSIIIFYAHLNITSFSYYMLSLHFLLIALLLIYDYKNKESKVKLIVAGAIFALSVLSLPSLVVVYVINVLACVAVIILGKVSFVPLYIKNAIRRVKLPQKLGYTFIGICIPAVIFLVYMLSKISISELISSVPYILIDNEHDFTYGFLFRKFFRSLSDVYGRWTYAGYLMIIVSFVFMKWLKKKPFCYIVTIICTILFAIYAVKSFGHTGYIQSAFCLAMIPVFFVSEKKNHSAFRLFMICGMLLAMTYSFSSSDFLYVLAIGHFISAIACILAIYDFATGESKENISVSGKLETNWWYKKMSALSRVLLYLAIGYMCCVTFSLRISNIYRDAPIINLTERISVGPAKGLYTTPLHKQMYDDVIKVLDEYGDDNQTVLFSKILPWGYMYIKDECGYPTTWRSTSYTEEQLKAYYDINPEKKPDKVFVLNEEYGSYDACGDVDDDHNPNLDEMNDYWKNYISGDDFEEITLKCGKLYRRVE